MVTSLGYNIIGRENLYKENCVYKFTLPSGQFVIGHTTQVVATRLRQYLSPSSTSRLHFAAFNHNDLKIEVLHTNNNEELLKLLEQLEILNCVGHILNENGLFVPPHKINNYHMSFGSVKKSLMLNKVFDGISLLRKFFNGDYHNYFKEYPFHFTYKWD